MADNNSVNLSWSQIEAETEKKAKKVMKAFVLVFASYYKKVLLNRLHEETRKKEKVEQLQKEEEARDKHSENVLPNRPKKFIVSYTKIFDI